MGTGGNAILCGIFLAIYATVAAGQGFFASSSTILGLDSNAVRLQELYKSSQDWIARYKLSPKSACSSRNSKSLCAAVATDAVDAYNKLVMATSPAVYSATNSSQAGAAGLVAPPDDQQGCNTCSAFAVAAAAETAMASVLCVKAQDCSISVQALYFCPPDRPVQDCSAGWDLPSVLAQLQARGQTLPTADCLPYKPDYKGELSKAATCTGSCDDTNAYVSLGTFSTRRVTSMWEAQHYIRQYGSVVTRFDVFTDFRPFFADKRNAKAVYKPSTRAKIAFVHAVVLVGYDNQKQFWLVKNSWGTQWADGGFFRVAYGECSVLTPGTGEAYAVVWSPTSTPAAIKLPVTRAGQSLTGCYWYKARPGDYLSKIAWLAGIALDKFILDNVGNVKDVSVLPPGTKLLLCNPRPGSIQAVASSPEENAACPSVVGFTVFMNRAVKYKRIFQATGVKDIVVLTNECLRTPTCTAVDTSGWLRCLECRLNTSGSGV